MKPSKRATVAAGAAAVTAAIGLLANPSPAMAATASCTITSFWAPYKRCTTPSLQANAAHDLRIYVFGCSGSTWWVWDINTQRSIAHGKGNANIVVHGLYGYYKGKFNQACQHNEISLEQS